MLRNNVCKRSKSFEQLFGTNGLSIWTPSMSHLSSLYLHELLVLEVGVGDVYML